MNQTILENVSAEQIPSLIADLGNSDGSTRQQARRQLIAAGSPAVPALTEALSDCHDQVRWEAAKILGKIHDSAAADGLVKLLEDKNVDIRWAAAGSLVLLRQHAVAPVLIRLVKNFDSVWLREGSRYVLRQLKKRAFLDKPALSVLVALDGPAPEVQVPWAVKSALDAMGVDWRNADPSASSDPGRATDIPMGAEVNCSDGGSGKIVCVILNPVDEQITHLVVECKDFPQNEYLVPVDYITQSTPNSVELSCNTGEMKKMKLFTDTEFLPNTMTGLNSAPSMLWPYDAPGYGVIVVEHEHIPQNELAVHRGSQVIAKDGPVGKVDEFLIDPQDSMITHLILREGHFWNREEVTIPVSQIDHIEEDMVYLKLDKCAIEALPAIPLRHKKTA